MARNASGRSLGLILAGSGTAAHVCPAMPPELAVIPGVDARPRPAGDGCY